MASKKPITSGGNLDGFQRVFFHLETLFLFTKSDFKTVMLPQSVFALVLALSNVGSVMAPTISGLEITIRFPFMVSWIWLHMLITAISNQRQPEAIVEDKLNKPWRPLPAARLSPSQAQALLRVALPLALIFSFLLGSFVPSVTLMTFLWLYNDLEGSSADPLIRNGLNAIGLSCFGWGATTALFAGEISAEGQRILVRWMALMAAMMATTVQAQDFPDTAGDIARGRKTIPVLYGSNFARTSLAVPAIAWSIAIPAFWNAEPLAWFIPMAIGGTMAVLTILRRDQVSNERVWQLWCLWQTTMYILPLFSRIESL
ncbi:UbiA prenyltransferase family-domain-containing protein [Xylaria scruposa]|nr:UbiA prenyltransferase family-domain-containing protein [Xylaria scruposa]